MRKWVFCKICKFSKEYGERDHCPYICKKCGSSLWILHLTNQEYNIFEKKIKELGIIEFAETIRNL